MDYHFILGLVGGSCSAIAIVYYVKSILQKETKPNRASWIIWNITNIILLASYFSVGARSTIFIPIVYMFNGFIVLFLSFRYGVSSWSRLDSVSLCIAGVSLIIWFITKNPLIALLMNLAMDSAGYLPTIKKSYFDPSSENKTAWLLIFLGACFNLFAISHFSFNLVVYPVVMFLMNAAVVVTLFFRKFLPRF